MNVHISHSDVCVSHICLTKRHVTIVPGVGSGVMIGPLLLELGMRPEPASATTAFMIVSIYTDTP